MIGFVWETPESLQHAEQFVRQVRPDLLTIHFAHPYPGTRYYDDFSNAGLRVQDRRAQAAPANSVREVTEAQLTSCARHLLRKHYVRPRVLASIARKGIQNLGDSLPKLLSSKNIA